MKKILFLLLWTGALAAQNINLGDNNDDNMKKYWFYRTKLVNDFMLVGTGQGMSESFNQRASTSHTNPLTGNTLNVGDEISTLGYYIGVLATEYRLLVNNHQDDTKVVHELFCALNAVNRLDYTCESTLGTCPGGSLDGFLMRDDIDPYFVRDNYNHFNYFHPDGGYIDTASRHFFPNKNGNDDRGFASVVQEGIYAVGSSLTSYLGNPTNKELLCFSQDHAASLLMGLGLVHSLVDPGAIDGSNNFAQYEVISQNSNGSLKKEAENITERVVGQLKLHNWHLQIPCTGIDVNINNGGDVGPYSYPFAEAGCIISGQGTSMNSCTSCTMPKACGNYHDAITLSSNALYWQPQAIVQSTSKNNGPIQAQLSAACNCIYSTLAGTVITQIVKVLEKVWKWLAFFVGYILEFVETVFETIIPQQINNITNDGMMTNVKFYDYEYAPFIRRLIHGGGAGLVPPEAVRFYGATGDDYITTLLNNAPCSGPWNSGANGASTVNGNCDWTTSSRIDHPEQITCANYGPLQYNLQAAAFTGEYNGIDYMLYYNVWQLYHNIYISPGTFNMIDLSDRIINENFTGNVGTAANPLEVDAFETITINGNYASGAYINFHPGKTAVIKGASCHISGSSVHFQNPSPFSCSGYLSVFNARQSNEPGNNSINNPKNTIPVANSSNSIDPTIAVISPKNLSGFNYTSTDMGIAKTHYVNYLPEVIDYKPTPPITINNPVTKKSGLNTTSQSMQEAMVKTMIGSMIETDIEVIPNPNSGTFKLKLPSSNKSSSMNVWVYDMTGKLILSKDNVKNVSDEEAIDISSFDPGNYYVRILTNDGKHYATKLVTQ
jgi:hypothetical protein